MANNSSLRSNNSSAPEENGFTITVLLTLSVGVSLWVILAHATIIVFYTVNRSQAWTTYSKQILSLSFNDFVVGLVGIVMAIWLYPGQQVVPYSVCASSNYFYCSSLNANMYHVLAICIHRAHMLVKEPTTIAPTGTLINVFLLILGWIPAFVFTAIPFALWAEDRVDMKRCVLNRIFGYRLESAIVFMVVSYLIPLVCTNIVYGVTFYKLVARMKRTFPTQTATTVHTISTSQQPSDLQASANTTLNSNRPGMLAKKRATVHTISTSQQPSDLQASANTTLNSSRPGMLAKKRATVTIGLLLIFFNLFSLPIIATMCIEVSGFEVGQNARVAVADMFVMNSVVSPFVYAVRVKHLRQAMKHCMPCFSRQTPS